MWPNIYLEAAITLTISCSQTDDTNDDQRDEEGCHQPSPSYTSLLLSNCPRFRAATYIRAENSFIHSRHLQPVEFNNVWCMYVCIEVALRGIAHGIGRSNWAKGRDPSGSWVQYPNPAVPSVPGHSRWVILTHYVRFLSQLYSRQLRVPCILL